MRLSVPIIFNVFTILLVISDLGLRHVEAESNESLHHALAIIGDPSIVTCPTANCPKPPVLSTFFLHGTTTQGSQQSEWLSNIGLFVSSGAPDGQKVAQYIGTMQTHGAGTAWALNTDIVRNGNFGGTNSIAGFEGSGTPGLEGAIGEQNGSIGYELDFTNWDANSFPGKGAFTVGQYVHAQGSFQSLSALYLDAHMSDNGNKAWTDGILFNGENLIADNTVLDASSSHNVLNVEGHHNTALNTSGANSDIHAVLMSSGQTICFENANNCLSWSAGRLHFRGAGGQELFSVDSEGNMRTKGHVYEMTE